MKTHKQTFGDVNNISRKEPLSDTQLLISITIGIFFVMYILAMVVWGGGFLRPQQLFDMLNNNASLIIIACSLTIVMVGRGIDISVGGVTALVVMSCVVHLNGQGGSIISSIILALGIGLAFGLVQGYLISYLDIQPFIVTLAGMFFARGMTTIVSVEPQTAQHAGFLALRMRESKSMAWRYRQKREINPCAAGNRRSRCTDSCVSCFHLAKRQSSAGIFMLSAAIAKAR